MDTDTTESDPDPSAESSSSSSDSDDTAERKRQKKAILQRKRAKKFKPDTGEPDYGGWYYGHYHTYIPLNADESDLDTSDDSGDDASVANWIASSAPPSVHKRSKGPRRIPKHYKRRVVHENRSKPTVKAKPPRSRDSGNGMDVDDDDDDLPDLTQINRAARKGSQPSLNSARTPQQHKKSSRSPIIRETEDEDEEEDAPRRSPSEQVTELSGTSESDKDDSNSDHGEGDDETNTSESSDNDSDDDDAPAQRQYRRSIAAHHSKPSHHSRSRKPSSHRKRSSRSARTTRDDDDEDSDSDIDNVSRRAAPRHTANNRSSERQSRSDKGSKGSRSPRGQRDARVTKSPSMQREEERLPSMSHSPGTSTKYTTRTSQLGNTPPRVLPEQNERQSTDPFNPRRKDNNVEEPARKQSYEKPPPLRRPLDREEEESPLSRRSSNVAPVIGNVRDQSIPPLPPPLRDQLGRNRAQNQPQQPTRRVSPIARSITDQRTNTATHPRYVVVTDTEGDESDNDAALAAIDHSKDDTPPSPPSNKSKSSKGSSDSSKGSSKSKAKRYKVYPVPQVVDEEIDELASQTQRASSQLVRQAAANPVRGDTAPDKSPGHAAAQADAQPPPAAARPVTPRAPIVPSRQSPQPGDPPRSSPSTSGKKRKRVPVPRGTTADDEQDSDARATESLIKRICAREDTTFESEPKSASRSKTKSASRSRLGTATPGRREERSTSTSKESRARTPGADSAQNDIRASTPSASTHSANEASAITPPAPGNADNFQRAPQRFLALPVAVPPMPNIQKSYDGTMRTSALREAVGKQNSKSRSPTETSKGSKQKSASKSPSARATSDGLSAATVIVMESDDDGDEIQFVREVTKVESDDQMPPVAPRAKSSPAGGQKGTPPDPAGRSRRLR